MVIIIVVGMILSTGCSNAPHGAPSPATGGFASDIDWDAGRNDQSPTPLPESDYHLPPSRHPITFSASAVAPPMLAAIVPGLNNQIVPLGLPEAIFHRDNPRLFDAYKGVVWRCYGSYAFFEWRQKDAALRVDAVGGENSITVRLALTNRSTRPWRDVGVVWAMNPGAIPDFQDPGLRQTYIVGYNGLKSLRKLVGVTRKETFKWFLYRDCPQAKDWPNVNQLPPPQSKAFYERFIAGQNPEGAFTLGLAVDAPACLFVDRAASRWAMTAWLADVKNGQTVVSVARYYFHPAGASSLRHQVRNDPAFDAVPAIGERKKN